MTKDDLVKQGDDYYIHRRRGKSMVHGSWWVPPEVAGILEASMKKTPPSEENLAFLTENGQPLQHPGTDAIKLTWNRCLVAKYGDPRAEDADKSVKRLPFGRLRKLGGQLVQDITGNHTLAQMHLCHKADDIASKHYTHEAAISGIGKPLQERLYDAQRELWRQIKPMFFPVAKEIKTALAA